jgi:rare lipoprotein A
MTGCGWFRPEPTPEVSPPPVIPLGKNAYEVDGQVYYRLDSAHGFFEAGVASWYGEPFHAKNTANGEIYNMDAMTAAHKTLPFGTMVMVKNMENNRTTIVRINDRGPFCRGRIIDLSRRAAEEIGMIRKGTAPVEITALGTDAEVLSQADLEGPDSPYFTGEFTIQAGAFGSAANAEALKQSIEKITDHVHISPIEKDGASFYRVRVGPFTSLVQARRMEERLTQNGFENIFTVAGDL